MKVSKNIYSKLKKDPFDYTFNLVEKKFTMQILRNMLFDKQTRFNEFLNSIEGISPRILSRRLKEMEANGLIERIVFDKTPIKIEYKITQRGKNIKPLLTQMAKFSIKHYSDVIFKDKKLRTIEQIFTAE